MNLSNKNTGFIQKFIPSQTNVSRVGTLFTTVLLLFSILSLLQGRAFAGQLTSRSLTLSTAITPSSTAQYKFTFTPSASTAIQGLKFEACTTALGTCNTPTGLSFSSGTFVSQTFAQANNFAVDATGANDCTPSARIICANRTQAVAESVAQKDITFGTITNPTTANSTFFVRMTTYTVNTYAGGNIADTGTVAAAIVATITISARVAEVLNFCVGSTAVNDATTTTGTDCTAISGTSVNIGVIEPSKINVSPVLASPAIGNVLNGVAMLRTNASTGATVTYRAIQQSGTNHQGAMRVVGASCNAGNINTDQCIDSKGTTQGVLTAGTESFGMTIAAINCGSTTAYTCTYSSGTYNLTRNAQYDGTGANTYPTDSDLVTPGPTNAGYAWREDGAVDTVASSTGPVDDEALVLKFAATPNSITPTGSYQAQADFIVIATF